MPSACSVFTTRAANELKAMPSFNVETNFTCSTPPNKIPFNEHFSLLVSLERLVLQMLGQKCQRIPNTKNGIALTLLSHPRLEPNFLILQGNGLCLIGKLVPDSSARLLLHIVKGPYHETEWQSPRPK